MQQLHVGQRCISEGEPELGLGTVQDVETNRIEVLFPALDTPRLYARREAPLKRVSFVEGDVVPHADGFDFTVTAVEAMGELMAYLGKRDDGSEVIVPEAKLADYVVFDSPRQRLLTGQLDGNRWFELRNQVVTNARRLAASDTVGLLGARAELLPHQLYVARQATEQTYPRVLLSDEVGLGKTIEAGLIVRRLLLLGRAQRVLIVVPEALQHQWLVEMLRRFSLRFSLLNDADFDAGFEAFDNLDLDEIDPDMLAAALDSPFANHELVLCSVEQLLASPERVDQALDANFDALVVDEAHHLHWEPGESSPAYDAMQQLCEAIPSVLLLTATPQQLGFAGHFARLHLIDPLRYADYDAFVAEQDAYIAVAELAAPLAESPPAVNAAQRSALQAKLVDAASQRILADEAIDDDGGRALLRKLIDQYGTGRAVYRNTRAAISGFPERKLALHHLAPLEPDADRPWWRSDARVAWLIGHLKQQYPRRFLLICESSETCQEIAEALRVMTGIAAAVFHEDLSIVEGDRAAAFFADEENGTQILLSSALGAEGRNFQYVSDLVLFDLPSNPDRLEQRIGRLDRIGQRNDITVHVPAVEGSRDARLARWYHEGLNAFEQSCAYGAYVVEQIGDARDAAIASDDAAAFDALLLQTRELAAQTQQSLQQGRDRLLEWQSLQPEAADELADDIRAQEHQFSAWTVFEQAADCYGLEVEELAADRYAVRVGDHAQQQDFAGLPSDGASFTPSRALALSREDVEFLSWEHPLLAGLMEDIVVSNRGRVTVASLSAPELKAGEVFVESFFILECNAPATLGFAQYLPAKALRLLHSRSMVELSAKIPSKWFSKRVKHVKKTVARQLVEAQLLPLRQRVLGVEAEAAKQLPALRDSALAAMEDAMGAELARAAQLGAGSDDLDEISLHRDVLRKILGNASLRFESMRLIFTH